MADFNSGGKTVAAAGGSEKAAKALKRIFEFCGRTNFSVQPAEKYTVEENRTAILLEAVRNENVHPGEYALCAVQYSLVSLPEYSGLKKLVTFSTECNGADFTARNIRTAPDGNSAFEIVGVGIIGRVHLKTNAPDAVETALAAASAAIAAGVSFAEVLKAINGLDSADW